MLTWRPDVHVAEVDEDLVLLDLAADTYGVIAQGAALNRALAGDAEDLASVALVPQLRDAGVLVNHERRPPSWILGLPLRDLRDEAVVRPGVVELACLSLALADLLARYPGRRIRELAADVRPRPLPQEPEPAPRLLRAAKAFERLAPWTPAPRKCLARSYLLLRFLQRSGLDARWVFGVRTWPFSAHCWLQAGEVALDDAPERLRAYTPILVV